MKIRSVRIELLHADGRTDRPADVTKLIVAFHNFANASISERNNEQGIHLLTPAFSGYESKLRETQQTRLYGVSNVICRGVEPGLHFVGSIFGNMTLYL